MFPVSQRVDSVKKVFVRDRYWHRLHRLKAAATLPPTHISMSKHCTLDLASSTSHLFLFGPASDNLIEGQMNPSLASKKSGWLLRPATSPPQAMSLATSLSHHQQQQLGGNRAEASPRLLSGESNHTKL